MANNGVNVQLNLEFDDLLKEARRLPTYTGDDETTSLNTWLDEVNTLLSLTPPGDQKSYIFRLILHKLQNTIQEIPQPTWENVKQQLMSTFGISETHSIVHK